MRKKNKRYFSWGRILRRLINQRKAAAWIS